jgi:hypothetical protein
MKTFIELREELYAGIKQLKSSIDDAMINMSKMYGEEHYAIQRLKSYYPALDKQLEYANDLDESMRTGNHEGTAQAIARIQAISDMIRTDAKSLLNSLHTGKDIIPDTKSLH